MHQMITPALPTWEDPKPCGECGEHDPHLNPHGGYATLCESDGECEWVHICLACAHGAPTRKWVAWHNPPAHRKPRLFWTVDDLSDMDRRGEYLDSHGRVQWSLTRGGY